MMISLNVLLSQKLINQHQDSQKVLCVIVDEVGDRPEQIEVTYSNNKTGKKNIFYSCVLL